LSIFFPFAEPLEILARVTGDLVRRPPLAALVALVPTTAITDAGTRDHAPTFDDTAALVAARLGIG